MTVLHPGSLFVKQMMKILGLPRHVKSCELRMAVGEIASVKCEYYPENFIIRDDELVRRIGTYELHQVKPPIEIPPLPQKDIIDKLSDNINRVHRRNII